MNILITDRRSGAKIFFPGLFFKVARAKWDIYGGPSTAEVVVSGSAARLGQLVQLLRSPVVLSDESGAPSWWGYVHGVEIRAGYAKPEPARTGLVLSVSLDDLYNRVAVRYRDERISPDVNVGWQFQTAWQQDAYSVAEYGKKEGIFSRPGVSRGFAEEAASYAASLLARYKKPGVRSAAEKNLTLPFPEGKGQNDALATLHLRGWWETLGWQFFSEGRGYLGFNGGGAVQVMGSGAASTAAAESFTVGAAGWTLVNGWVKMAKYGAPGDGVYMSIYDNNAGLPNNILGTVSVAGSALSGDLAWTRFQLAAGIALSAGATYWIVVYRTGALDANNYYRVAVDEGMAYPGGAMKVWNGVSWVDRALNADMVFAVNGQAVSTEQIKVMADPAAGGGQFLAGVYVVDGSGVNAWQFRNGKESCLSEIKGMLDMGTSAGERLQAVVNAEKWLVVRKVASASAPGFLILPSGELRDRSGGRVAPGLAPVGKWARVQGFEQVGGESSALGAVLITSAEWDGQRMIVSWE